MSRATTPAFSPTSRLLLACARLHWAPDRREALRKLVAQVEDWAGFAKAAVHRQLAPLALQHLRAHAIDLVPHPVLGSLQRAVARSTRNSLKLRAEQRWVFKQILEPLDVRHLWFKGPSLAERYFDDPAQRPCRDLDVLIDPTASRRVLAELLRHGYRTVDPEESMHNVGEIRFVARLRPMPALRSPRDVVVEVEKSLEKFGRRFDTASLLVRPEMLRLDGCSLPVLPTATLFVYLCRHHTRHAWSRLHWLADLDAISRHATFDEAEVMAEARRRRSEPTVRASLELLHLCSEPENLEPAATPGPVGDLVRDVARMMTSDSATERAEARSRTEQRQSHPWQVSPPRPVRRLLATAARAPRLDDYRRWPLPERWFWLYRLLHPLGVLMRRRASASRGRPSRADSRE